MRRGSHSPNRICIPPCCVTCQKSSLLLHAGVLENSHFADPSGELKVVLLTEDNIMERVVLTAAGQITFIPVISSPYKIGFEA